MSDPSTPSTPGAGAMASDMAQAVNRTWSRSSTNERLVIGGGVALVVLYLLGVILQSLASDTSWLVAAILGAVAAAVVVLPASLVGRSFVPAPAIVLGMAHAAAAIVVLEGLELLFDLDRDLESGGILFVALVVLLAVAGAAAAIGAWRIQPASPAGALRRTLAGASRGDRLAIAGTLVFLAGWAVMVTIGVFRLNLQGSLVIGAVALGAVAILTRDLPGWRIAPAWVAAAMAVVAGLVGLAVAANVAAEAVDIGAGLDLLWTFLVMLVGLVAFVGGALLAAYDARMARSDAAPVSSDRSGGG